MKIITTTGLALGVLLAVTSCGQEKEEDASSPLQATTQSPLGGAESARAAPGARKLMPEEARAQDRAVAPGQAKKPVMGPPPGHMEALLAKIRAEKDDQARKGMIIEYVQAAETLPAAEKAEALAKLEAIWKR
jgi:hypothetical protein